MVHGLNDNNSGHLTKASLEQIAFLLEGKDALVIGPGLTHGAEVAETFAEILKMVHCPMVIDADGLNIIANQLNLLETIEVPVVLTPHPGEMARLCGITTAQVQSNRLKTAQDFAKAYHVNVVLKGANTIIAAPDGQVWINTVDSPALACAGSGDVLAGIIGAFLAQGFSPEIAATAAVNLHGQAGCLIAEEKGEISSQSGDLVEGIVKIMKEVRDKWS